LFKNTRRILKGWNLGFILSESSWFMTIVISYVDKKLEAKHLICQGGS